MAGALKHNDSLDKRTRMVLLAIGTAGYGGLALVGAVGALFSPLVFDERGNLLNPLAWLAFLLMIGFWIACIVGPFAAWIMWRRNREPMAWAAMAAPLIWGIATITVLQFVPG